MVIGAGGMGRAIAQRIGGEARLLLADHSPEVLAACAEQLRGEGHEVTTRPVDVASRTSVAELAGAAAELGEVRRMAHTAGLSPVQASAERILAVDLLGVALVLEEFGRVMAPGGSGVVISSMAGHRVPPLPEEEASALATAPAEDLLSLPLITGRAAAGPGAAYSVAKHANHLRVQAASTAWGERGARVNSISPGVVSTPMGRGELDSEHGASMRAVVGASNAGRLGTPTDIAAAAEYLLGPASSFVSGTDLLVDGGVTAAVATGHLG
ncbi:short-chain dehydrogenase/reductas [Nocardiopsis kunsanensis]|uniref:Short-chain dehydrogenase/reductas n=1 Tax=Nocardiopsis kunsanensis TaxID=141693 RepID=A0A918XJR6_9ACTN|nr:short-chain dehydrogenase/reductas [Nocardiopsis kunsanensis]